MPTVELMLLTGVQVKWKTRASRAEWLAWDCRGTQEKRWQTAWSAAAPTPALLRPSFTPSSTSTQEQTKLFINRVQQREFFTYRLLICGWCKAKKFVVSHKSLYNFLIQVKRKLKREFLRNQPGTTSTIGTHQWQWHRFSSRREFVYTCVLHSLVIKDCDTRLEGLIRIWKFNFFLY